MLLKVSLCLTFFIVGFIIYYMGVTHRNCLMWFGTATLGLALILCVGLIGYDHNKLTQNEVFKIVQMDET